MGGSEFTKTLCTGLGAPIIDFRGLPQSRAQGHGELGPPHPCRVGGKRRLVQAMTVRGLLYLAVHNNQKS